MQRRPRVVSCEFNIVIRFFVVTIINRSSLPVDVSFLRPLHKLVEGQFRFRPVL